MTTDGSDPSCGSSSRLARILGINPPTYWDGPPVPPGPDVANPQARHLFSLNTCSGCHTGETDTEFLHVRFRRPGHPAPLSGFLTGIDVTDTADGAPVRHFDDLERRAQDLDTLASSLCLAQILKPGQIWIH